MPHEPLLENFFAPAAAKPFLHQIEAATFIEVPRCIKATERPELDFCETSVFDEVERCGKQLSTAPGPLGRTIKDEPAQMGDVFT